MKSNIAVEPPAPFPRYREKRSPRPHENATNLPATHPIFTVTGGGTLLISNTDPFTMRLDQNATAENGVLRILGGSLVNFTGNQGPWNGEASSGSKIELSGFGSTLMAEGTFNSTTNFYNRGGIAGEALPISATGVGETLNVSYNAGTNVTTFTVVPEPSIALMGALGALGLLRRRR